LRPPGGSATLGAFKAILEPRTGASALKLSEHLRSTHNLDGAVILDILHGQMYRLNFVGSRMLELLKHGLTNEQIADAISQEFAVPREVVATDLAQFLSHLEKHNLLQLAETGERPR
jgi:hypothetical protein